MVGNSNDKTNFLRKLLLRDRQVARHQISKIIKLGGFLGDLTIGLTDAAFRAGIEASKKVNQYKLKTQ